MKQMNHKPFADKYNGLLVWSKTTKPELSDKQRNDFVLNIMRKRFGYLFDEANKAEKSAINKAKRHRKKVYSQGIVKELESANIGECFCFISNNSGNEYYLKCVGIEERNGYDWKEWSVACRDYKYYVPRFVDSNGKHRSFKGKAVIITEEEFNKITNKQ